MNLDFKTVVPAAQAGDKAARDKLMAEFYAWSVTQARRFVRNSEASKNVAVSFWEWMYTKGGIAKYDATVPLLTWMTSQIRKLASRETRKGRPTIMYCEEVRDERVESDRLTHLEAAEDLRALADTLPTYRHREVYWRLVEGATPKEIGEELGLNAPRVRKLVKDVRDAITERLGDGQ